MQKSTQLSRRLTRSELISLRLAIFMSREGRKAAQSETVNLVRAVPEQSLHSKSETSTTRETETQNG